MNTEPKKNDMPGLMERLRAKLPQKLPSFVLRNWPWRLLALVLAVCLWAGLITQDPTLTRERIFSDVTLNVTNADILRRNSGLVVVSGLEPENLNVRMRVEVPQRAYSTVSAVNFNPRLDLTRISGVGEQELRVTTTSTTSYGSVEDVQPDTVTVVVDEYVTNYRIPVIVEVTGSYPEGYYGSGISLDPSAVAVSGPKTLVDQVSRVVVEYDVSRLSARAGKVRSARTMRFLDSKGNEVDSSMLEATSADVVLRTIVVEQTLYPKRTIPLNTTALIEGEPAEGYRVKSVSVSPDTLMVAGEKEALELVDDLFLTSPVNVNGATATFYQQARVRRPAELEHLSADAVTVTVEIEPILVACTYPNTKLAARGTGSGLKAALEKKTLSVVLTGPQLVVENLRSSKVTAYVDVNGLKAGEYVLPVQLHVEGADMSQLSYEITPATVQVTLTEH